MAAVRTSEQLVSVINSRLVEDGDCLIWPGATFTQGYGLIHHDGKHKGVHKVIWEATHGPLQENLMVDHKCHNPPCAKLSHLRPVTRKQNGENRKGSNKNSKTGIRGVSYKASHKAFAVALRHNGKDYRGGYFKELIHAEQAAINLRQKFFTHSN